MHFHSSGSAFSTRFLLPQKCFRQWHQRQCCDSTSAFTTHLPCKQVVAFYPSLCFGNCNQLPQHLACWVFSFHLFQLNINSPVPKSLEGVFFLAVFKGQCYQSKSLLSAEVYLKDYDRPNIHIIGWGSMKALHFSRSFMV